MVVKILKTDGNIKAGEVYRAIPYRYDSEKTTLLNKLDPETFKALSGSMNMNEYNINLKVIGDYHVLRSKK